MPLEFRGPHLEFLHDETNELDLEGARYSGKTWVCCAKVVESALKYPGIEWLICRYSNETTRTKLKPEFRRIAGEYGVSVEWDDKESVFLFPEVGGKVSKVYAYGLKSQSIIESLSKVRGLGIACCWNDQSEELPIELSEELRFATRQPGYPHQLIFSPNPPPEDHFLPDQFPEENPFPHRKYYRVSLYDNAHNLAPGKIEELEALYPVTHAKYKSLIMGLRGPNVVGSPVYDGVFLRHDHVGATIFDPHSRLLEAIHVGQHHPVWTVAQRTPLGGLKMLGGVMGKRMFLEDFLPTVEYYRTEWFENVPRDQFRLCTDPPPSDETGVTLRYTHLNILREAGLKPVYRDKANAPDVRESTIQNIAGIMRKHSGFTINSDLSRWIMVTPIVTKQTKLFVDGCEGSYVWDPHMVSVGNKSVRQPKSDQWVDGWQRCLENTVLNFSAGQPPTERKPIQHLRHPVSSQHWMGV